MNFCVTPKFLQYADAWSGWYDGAKKIHGLVDNRTDDDKIDLVPELMKYIVCEAVGQVS